MKTVMVRLAVLGCIMIGGIGGGRSVASAETMETPVIHAERAYNETAENIKAAKQDCVYDDYADVVIEDM